MAEPEAMLWLDLHVAVQKQLFNSMDPAPFRKRDLDPVVSAYIVDWAEGGAQLVEQLDRSLGRESGVSTVRDKVHYCCSLGCVADLAHLLSPCC